MNLELASFPIEHATLIRRYVLRCGTAGLAALGSLQALAENKKCDSPLQKVLDDLETWLTR